MIFLFDYHILLVIFYRYDLLVLYVLRSCCSIRGTSPEFGRRDLRKARKTPVRITGILAWIRTQHFQNTQLQHYRYAKLLGANMYVDVGL
jgi:hypothetical protein